MRFSVISEGFLWDFCAWGLSVSQQRLCQEFSATHPAAPHSTSRLFAILLHHRRHWNVPFPSLSLYRISHSSSSTHLLPCILVPVIFSLFHHLSFLFSFFFFKSHSLKMTGLQIRVRICNIRREGQASARWGHSYSGIRCAAKWTGHGTTVVSWIIAVNERKDF